MKKTLLIFFFLTISSLCFSQEKIDINAFSFPQSWKNEANSIVIDRQKRIEIVNQNSMKNTISELYLISNEKGLKEMDFSVYYDKLTKIKALELKLYNKAGELVRTIKEKDFLDLSIADGFCMFTDNRIKFLKLNYTHYPFYAKFDYEVIDENTITIFPFIPIQREGERIAHVSYSLTYPPDFSINPVEKNLKAFRVVADKNTTAITYSGQDMVAPDQEDLNMRYIDLLPVVRFSNNKFALAGVKGTANSWEDFGIWYHKNMLNGLDELPANTVTKMQMLTKDAQNDVEKARIIFDYVQNNTRYISIQVGLGGWKPLSAKEVDKLGYGDCKALTNYTKALLKSIGITAYYTIIHASNSVVDIDEKVISLQGNHVILTIPSDNGNIFLECTSQKIPFGYLGISTDNRKALIIKPDGAYFVKTLSIYANENNLDVRFIVDMSDLHLIKTTASFENKGTFYNAVYSLNVSNKEEVISYIKKRFSNLKMLKIVDYHLENDKEQIIYKEQVKIESDFIGAKMGNDYMISLNPFLNIVGIPKNYKERQSGFYVTREKKYKIEIMYLLPSGFKIMHLPDYQKIESQFGTNEITLKQEGNTLFVTEEFLLKSGEYKKEEYADFRKFLLNAVEHNNAKFILTKI